MKCAIEREFNLHLDNGHVWALIDVVNDEGGDVTITIRKYKVDVNTKDTFRKFLVQKVIDSFCASVADDKAFSDFVGGLPRVAVVS